MEIRDLITADKNLTEISDKDLYHICQEYGRGIKALRRVFAVLLVEVFRRNLHRKYGFQSIHEFAAKVGGMNKAVVDQILWLERSLRDKPFLWREFRREGWSKVRVVANLATAKTDKFWAEKVAVLPKPALEVYVKALRKRHENEGGGKILTKDQTVPNYQVTLDDVIAQTKVCVESSGNLTIEQLGVVDNFPKNSGENGSIGLLERVFDDGPNLGEVNVWEKEQVQMRFKVLGETQFKFEVFKNKLHKKHKKTFTSGEALAILVDIAGKDYQ